MNNFIFHNDTKIIFGKDTELLASSETAKYGRKILVVCSRGASNKTGVVERVEKNLTDNGIEFIELTGIKPNPEMSKVYEGIELVRKNKLTFILAVGGGSIIDTAKGIAAGSLYDGDAWDLYMGRKFENAMPTGVVLTFPAAGSEASIASVITNEKAGYKADILGLCLRPRFAILNPELTLTLPDYQTFCGVVDMLSHVMERYFGSNRDNDLTDRLCEATMKTIIKNALILKNENINDYSARAELMWASTIAHNGLLETGRNMDWASHCIGTEISAIYDTTHGATLSVITPAWARYVYKENIPLFSQFATRVFDVEMDIQNPERTALEGIHRLEAFFKHIGVPTSMGEIGIDSDENFMTMAKKCTRKGPIGGVKVLGTQDILDIYHNAMK